MKLDIREIMKMLPHRYPLLLVDRVEELEVGKRIRGYKNLTINEAFFQGHYPHMPIMPGVLIVESMAQVGALLVLTDPQFYGYVPIIASLEKVKFRKPVVPGDRLTTEAETLWFRKNVGAIKTAAFVDGEQVAEAEIAFKLLKNGETI